eukprot:TRINITY_DN14617_c0_g1_i1.p2 TRINITY_DN14617_c0_g1~~TRINITY_DN14617_c0_g1_i1.p2  ORF type:complete len:335 (+),score=75.33 TRINITY_DN14617_c0_g1_i1:1088-2092(+)
MQRNTEHPGRVGIMADTQWMQGHKAVINSIAASAVMTSTVATASDDGTVRVWDVSVNKAVRCIDCFDRKGVDEVAWNGDVLLAASGANCYHIDTRVNDHMIVVKEYGERHDFEGDITSLTVNEGEVIVGLETGAVIKEKNGTGVRVVPHGNVVSGVGICGDTVWSTGMDCTLACTTYNAEGGTSNTIELPGLQLSGPQVINPPFPTSLSISSASGTPEVALGIMDGTVWVFNEEYEPLNVWKPHENVPVEDVVWQGSKLWTAGKNGYVALWEFPEDDEDEQEAEEDDASSSLVTAVQCPETVTCLACPVWLAERHIVTGDVGGNLALHTLPKLA